MPGTPDRIRLEIPKQRVAADLRGLARHLGEAAIQGLLLQNWTSAVTKLFVAADAIRIKRSDSALAWQLLLTGIGEALTEVANQQPPTLINERDTEIIFRRIEQEAVDLTIPVNFLDHPWSLPPVVLAKKTLLKWLAPPANSAVPQDLINLGRRFDSALVLGLHRAIQGDETHYRPLLARREDPTGLAWQVLEDWRRYRAWLVADFRTVPVFNESFAIDQLYVPLNAWYWVKQESNVKARPKKLRTVVNLNDDMAAWLRGERGSNRLRLVSGGPGSGKSSAMKALAATLDQAGNSDQPTNAPLFPSQPDVLLFPLQRFHWRTGIVESITATLNTYGDQMRHNPLDPNHLRDRQTPLLVIFDGLDELTASAQVNEAISTIFLRELNRTLRSWQDRPVWVIVTGRDAIFGNVEGATATLPGERLHLLPYHVCENEPDGPSRSDYCDPGGLLLTDNREKVFRRFAKAKGQPSDRLPEMYRNDDLHDLSAQPLLNYFVLTSVPSDISDGNLARIYANLFRRLHSRNRNNHERPQDQSKPAAALSQHEFDRAFEAMAVAVWRTGGTRSASWGEVLAEVDREDSYLPSGVQKLRDLFDDAMLDPGARRPFRLAAAFFSRNDKATGIEFTHRSFADYLYARRLAKEIASMADELDKTPLAELEMLRRWEELTSQQRISQEVRRFLELEIERTVSIQKLVKRHKVLASVVEQVFREGLQASEGAQLAKQHGNNMQEALFVAWHAMWRFDQNIDNRYWRLGENTGDLLHRSLARQESAYGFGHGSVFVGCWSGADLGGADLFGLNLQDADLRDANLQGANLQRANLQRANLKGADLKGANLTGADMEGANLERDNLQGANLERTNLMGADLMGANLEGAYLAGANLALANLQHANLREANLQGVGLEDADLEGADLQDANLKGADLEGAYLIGANMERANVERGNLRGSQLQRTKLMGAHFALADLTGADLQDANLKRANLLNTDLPHP